MDHAAVSVPPVRMRNQFHTLPVNVTIQTPPVALCVPTLKLNVGPP